MKCFTTYLEDLNGIFSPPFFISVPKNKAGFITLKDIADINPHTKVNNLDPNMKVPYVGLPETGNQEIQTILNRPYKEVKGRNIIKKGDILFARIEPSIFNKKYIFVKDLGDNDFAFTSTEFYVVKPKRINTKFLFYMFFTDTVYEQILGKTTGSTGRRRLDKGVFENLLIPLPSEKQQNRIVELLDVAYEQKKQKEQEAETFLSSIDDFVFEELGIKFPELKPRRCFSISSEELINNRIDPYYYQPCFKNMIKSLTVSRYPKAKVSEIIKAFVNGFDYRGFSKAGTPYLRVGNIRPFRIILDDVKYIASGDEIQKNIRLQKGNVLLTRKGSFGVAVSIKASLDYIICSEIFRLELKEGINADYIEAIFNSGICQKQFDREKIGAIMGSLSQEAVKSIIIPLPPMKIQNKIGDEVKSRLQEAAKLKAEAKTLIEKAKNEVEAIILGKSK